jgi:hypothetical protein
MSATTAYRAYCKATNFIGRPCVDNRDAFNDAITHIVNYRRFWRPCWPPEVIVQKHCVIIDEKGKSKPYWGIHSFIRVPEVIDALNKGEDIVCETAGS